MICPNIKKDSGWKEEGKKMMQELDRHVHYSGVVKQSACERAGLWHEGKESRKAYGIKDVQGPDTMKTALWRVGRPMLTSVNRTCKSRWKQDTCRKEMASLQWSAVRHKTPIEQAPTKAIPTFIRQACTSWLFLSAPLKKSAIFALKCVAQCQRKGHAKRNESSGNHHH